MLDDWSDYVAMFWNIGFGITGVILNTILLFFVFKHTPVVMRVYSTVIRTGAFCDIIVSFCATMTSPRAYSSGLSLIIMFQGLARFLPISRTKIPYLCFSFYAFQVHGYIFNLFVIMFSLYYRQRIVTNIYGILSQKKINFICYGFAIFAVAFTIFALVSTLPTEGEMDTLVREIRPELIGSNWTYYVIPNVASATEILTDTMNWVVVVCGIISRKRVHTKLSSFTMSAASRELQKSLLLVLLIQTTTPLAQGMAQILHNITTIWNDLQTPLIENAVEILPILLASTTPIVTIYFVEPYRTAVKQYLGLNDVVPIQTAPQSSSEQI